MTFDPTLYLVTDPRVENLLEKVRLAVKGGVSAVQFRQKKGSFDERHEKAIEFIKLLRPFEIPLIVNDDVHLAKEISAGGVHLGKSDAGPKEARAILGPDAVIGISVSSVAEFERSEFEFCNYVSASPVFETSTKSDCSKAMGLEELKNLRRICRLPLVSIGGIHSKNVSSLWNLRIDGIAVVQSILNTSDPRKAAHLLTAARKRHR